MPKNPIRQRPFRGLKAPLKPPKSAESFSDAMAREGTRPLQKGVERVPPARASRPRAIVASAPTFSLERDDEWIEGRRAGVTERTLERLRAKPMATLDLHRNDAETAKGRVDRFLSAERARGRDVVLIVVGRGRHSPGGHGVLRSEITGWLTALPASAHVLGFRTAPPELGGSGGILVLLAKRDD